MVRSLKQARETERNSTTSTAPPGTWQSAEGAEEAWEGAVEAAVGVAAAALAVARCGGRMRSWEAGGRAGGQSAVFDSMPLRRMTWAG